MQDRDAYREKLYGAWKPVKAERHIVPPAGPFNLPAGGRSGKSKRAFTGAHGGKGMTDSRRKGEAGEREAALLLQDLLGTAVVRNLTQTRDGGHDLIGIAGWSVEVKRAAKPRIAEWWAQAARQANGARPVLIYRIDRRPWRAVIALRDVVPGFEGQPRDDLTWTLEASLEVFAALVREALPTATVEPIEEEP